MRIKVILQNYNTIHTKYQELLSAMLKEQRGERMDEEFIRNRITELRLKKGVSEYQMSMELGQNRSYIQAISSGRSMPSMKQFLNICVSILKSRRFNFLMHRRITLSLSRRLWTE